MLFVKETFIVINMDNVWEEQFVRTQLFRNQIWSLIWFNKPKWNGLVFWKYLSELQIFLRMGLEILINIWSFEAYQIHLVRTFKILN